MNSKSLFGGIICIGIMVFADQACADLEVLRRDNRERNLELKIRQQHYLRQQRDLPLAERQRRERQLLQQRLRQQQLQRRQLQRGYGKSLPKPQGEIQLFKREQREQQLQFKIERSQW